MECEFCDFLHSLDCILLIGWNLRNVLCSNSDVLDVEKDDLFNMGVECINVFHCLIEQRNGVRVHVLIEF